MDVLIDNNNKNLQTSVYRKPTNIGTCLNGKSDCIEQYKINVINSYIKRVFKISATLFMTCHPLISFLDQNTFIHFWRKFLKCV